MGVPQSCDTVVALGEATGHGQTLFAKNSDRPADECQPLVQYDRRTHPAGAETRCQFLTIPQAGTTFRHVGSRPHWCWGYEHGFNEYQVVIGNEALHSKLPEAKEPRLIGMELLRLGLERGRSAVEAVEVMTGLISRYGQGKFANDAGVRTYDNGYIVADPHEAYVIETAGHCWAVRRVEGALGISNVYALDTEDTRVSPDAEAAAVEAGWWTAGEGRFRFADAFTAASRAEGSGATRRARSCAVLGHHRGGITLRTMRDLLRDHGGSEDPADVFRTEIGSGPCLCVHTKGEGKGGNTAASLIADLCADGFRLPVYWCSFYSPCLGLFLPIFLEGTLPPVLSVGSPEPDLESPWWRFHRLSCLARVDPEARVPEIRARWAPVQARLFETAYEAAAAGRRLLDEGEDGRASAMLTRCMAEHASAMLAACDELLAEFEAAPVYVEV